MPRVEILEQNGYHFLWINNYLWMEDVPAEMEAQEELAAQASGDVLVVGYGLGIVQGFLSKNKAVGCIETVEKHREVQAAYFEHFNKLIVGHVIFNDFYALPDPPYQKWDYIIGDIWPEISSKHLQEYITFKNHAQIMLNKGGKVLGYGAEYYEYLLEKQI